MAHAKTRKPVAKAATSKQSTITAAADFFGPPSLLEGEDAAAYYDLLEKMRSHVKPRDILEEIAVRDVVDITWEIIRLRRMREPLIVSGYGAAIADILAPRYGNFRGTELRDKWLNCESEARRQVAAYMKEVGLTQDDIHARAMTSKIKTIERFDLMIAQAEHRRRLILGELDRRRDAFARQLREAAEVIEVDMQAEGGEASKLPAPVGKAS